MFSRFTDIVIILFMHSLTRFHCRLNFMFRSHTGAIKCRLSCESTFCNIWQITKGEQNWKQIGVQGWRHLENGIVLIDLTSEFSMSVWTKLLNTNCDISRLLDMRGMPLMKFNLFSGLKRNIMIKFRGSQEIFIDLYLKLFQHLSLQFKRSFSAFSKCSIAFSCSI